MSEGDDIWQKYCSFLDLDFDEQVRYSDHKKNEYFNRWKKTKTAKQICPTEPERFEDIPLTVYEDYKILLKLREKIDKLEKTVTQKENELNYDYYERIGKQIKPLLEGWLPGEYNFSICTTGTTGKAKWIPYVKGEKFPSLFSIRTIILSCTDERGEPNLESGDKLLDVAAPVPYITGYGTRGLRKEFEVVPPAELTDNYSTIQQKIRMILECVEDNEAKCIGASGNFVKLLYKYFMKPAELFKENYQTSSIGLKKLAYLLLWTKSELFGKKYDDIREVLPLEGMLFYGVGASLYEDFIKESYGLEPLIVYGASEGVGMTGYPDRKTKIHPTFLDLSYYEFLDRDGNIHKINELDRNEVYEVIVTPFDSLLARYKMGDLVKVIDFKDDGMPVFEFEGRDDAYLSIYEWFRLTSRMAIDALKKSGWEGSDNWIVTKKQNPREKLRFIMEKDWKCSEREAQKRLFDSFYSLYSSFRDYVDDYQISDPGEVVEVDYVDQGTFKLYMIEMEKKGAPIGHYKPPKIITPRKKEMVEKLLEV